MREASGGGVQDRRRPRIACMTDGSVASSGIGALLRTVRRYEVVDHLDPQVDLVVVHLGHDPESQLSRVVETAAVYPLVAVGRIELVVHALGAGARGFVSTSAGTDELLSVVESALSGRRAITGDATEFLIGQTTGRPMQSGDLTDRQAEILRRVVAGEAIGAIARTLGVSRQAVGQTLERLRRRARVASNEDLARFVREHGLV